MEGLLQSLDLIEIKGLLESHTLLVQLIPILLISFILVKTSAKGKTNRFVPTLINFGMILFLNAMNIVNRFIISKMKIGNEGADIIAELFDIEPVVNATTYYMSGVNPITIMILLLILGMVDAGVFGFCLCTFSFPLIGIAQGESSWLGFIILSVALAFLCSKMYKGNVVIAYFVVSVCSVAIKVVLNKVNLYVIDSELMFGEITMSGIVLLTYIVLHLIRSVLAMSSLSATIIKIGKFAIVAAIIMILGVGIWHVALNVFRNIGEKEDKAITENFAESGTEASQLVTVVKGNSSSYLLSFSTGKSYTVDLSFDADLLTCWQDGSDGDGSGESLGYSFDGEHSIGKVCIHNGNLLSQEKYEANNRVQNVMIQFYNAGNKVYEQSVYLSDDFEQSQKGISFIMEERIACDQVILQVIDVYTGNRYNDLCIAEVKFYE